MSCLSFFVEGPPIPLGRHRVRVVAGKVTTYTPKDSRAYKERIALVARGAVARADRWDRDARFSVAIFVYDDRRTYDIDNVIKAVLDGITKARVVWVDDRRVDSISADRFSLRSRAEAARAGGGLAVVVQRIFASLHGGK